MEVQKISKNTIKGLIEAFLYESKCALSESDLSKILFKGKIGEELISNIIDEMEVDLAEKNGGMLIQRCYEGIFLGPNPIYLKKEDDYRDWEIDEVHLGETEFALIWYVYEKAPAKIKDMKALFGKEIIIFITSLKNLGIILLKENGYQLTASAHKRFVTPMLAYLERTNEGSGNESRLLV